jgi:hypothetical protein
MTARFSTIVRLILILLGVLCFAYSLNSGNTMARWVAIGFVFAAIAVRAIGRVMKRD